MSDHGLEAYSRRSPRPGTLLFGKRKPFAPWSSSNAMRRPCSTTVRNVTPLFAASAFARTARSVEMSIVVSLAGAHTF